MYLIVIGAGPIGWSLVEMAVRDRHQVVLIEKDEVRAKEASKHLDAVVLWADIGKGGILDEAGVDKAQALVATTPDDATNLMAMFLGVEHEVHNLVSIVNDSRHQALFKRLGVHVLLDPEVVVARHLYTILSQPKVEDMVTLEEDEQVFGVRLSMGSALVGKTPRSIREANLLPSGMVIVALKRGEQRSLISEGTRLAGGDHLTVYAQNQVDPATIRIFTAEETT